MEHFTGAAIQDQPAGRQWTVDPPFYARVRELVRDWGAEKSPELIEEMIVTALKIARDRMSVADLKLINRSIQRDAVSGEGIRAISALAKGRRFWFGPRFRRFARVQSGGGFWTGNSRAQFYGDY